MSSSNFHARTTGHPLLGLVLAAAATFLSGEAIAAGSGASLLKFNLTIDMARTGVEPRARGRIQELVKCSDSVDEQSLQVVLTRLNPETTYELTAFFGADTESTTVAEFTTNRLGAFRTTWRKSGNNRFPAGLPPISNIRELEVVNGGDEVVLTANMVEADRAYHRVEVSMDNNGFLPSAVGAFSMNSVRARADFDLEASGLEANTDYLFTINGATYETHTSDASGMLVVSTRSRPGWPDARDIQVVALTDHNGEHAVLTSSGLGIPTTCAAGPGSIVLNGAARFAVLAGADITNTGFTSIDGDVGLSPGALSSVTGFETATVNGLVLTADDPAQKPIVDQAKLDLTTAYNDAAGRSLNVILVSDGELGGKTLAPGLYRSGISSFSITSSDLTLDAQGDARATFIFQMPSSTLTVGNGRQVILAGGADAANIFWQVGTSATLGTTSVVEGTIMADQTIVLQTGATLNGRALARIAEVTMEANTISIP